MPPRMKPISQLESDVGPMDLLRIGLTATIQDKTPINGTDYAAGFFVGVHKVGETLYVALSRVQKGAYDQPTPDRYPFNDINGYEVLRRYEPDSTNPIDARVVEALGLGERSKPKNK